MTDLSVSLVDARLALPPARAPTSRGAVATAAWDEDALTLGAAAALALLDAHADMSPAALVVASTTAPLAEPGMAPLLAEILNLQSGPGPGGTVVQELSGSVAAGAGAVITAAALVGSGIGPVVVVAADTRRDSKGRSAGDGAVALLLDGAGDAGRFHHLGSSVEAFDDRWRNLGESTMSWGDRSLDRYSPARGLAGAFDPDTAALEIGVDRPEVAGAGFLGCAAFAASLITAERNEPVVVTASAGGVSHAFRFTPGPAFSGIVKHAQDEVAGGRAGPPPPRPDLESFNPYTSQPAARRERAQTLRLEARRDPETEKILYPPPPERTAAGMEAVRLARTGTVHTFARDHIYPVGGPLTMAVVALDGGGRFYGQVADGRTVAIGDRVRLVLRRLHLGGGKPNYFWKIQPTPREETADADLG
jgi:hypothetical protein